MKFVVTGTRFVNGDRRFTAPVEAESSEEAEETFLEEVSQPAEFDVNGVERDRG